MSEIKVYGRYFTANKFSQLTVAKDEEKKFLEECDNSLVALPRKELSKKLKEIVSKYSFGEVTARTILKIHERNYKPAPKTRIRKGQPRFTDEEKQVYIDRFVETSQGPTTLHKLELLKDRNRPNPSVAAISEWIRRSQKRYIRPSKNTVEKFEIKLIKELASFKTVKEIIEIITELGYKSPSRKTIENILEMEGISVKQGKSEDEKIYICEAALKYGIPNTPKILFEEDAIKTSETRIREYFHELNLELPDISNSYRKYELKNEDFFEVIDTEEKAYWLGFIAADGSVRLSKLLEIELKRSDKLHLTKFLKSLGTDKNIYLTSKYDKRTKKIYLSAKVAIFSKKIISDLFKYGITENKSLNMNIDLSKIPISLQKDFWRGMLDGDGWLADYKSSSALGLVSSEKTIKQFLIYNESNLSIKPPAITPKDNVYQAIYYSTEARMVLANHFYTNSTISLDRKYEKAKEWI